MRKRLSWDADRAAEIEKKADPYTMNQTRQNPPVEKYQTGDPDTWAETPNMATPWKGEGRTETGHPAPARGAVMAARKMEDKALKCVTIARRMLPGAGDDMIQDQATELMYLPDQVVVATLQRQASVAEIIAGKDEDEDEEEEKSAKGETTPPAEKKTEDEEKSAGKDEEEKPEDDEEEKSAGKDEEEKPEDEEKSAGDDETTPPAEKKPEEKEADLLDSLFSNEEIQAASESNKQGAKKLSGMVKAASEGGDPLGNLWDAPPDVSKVFK